MNFITGVERLIDFDENEKSYTYHILQAPFPVKEYYSTLKVLSKNDGNGARIEWSGKFTPVNVSDAEATALFQGIYEEGLNSLKGHFIK
ncbi:MAG: hypothetical protein DI539_22700 [Flavobacterium psychrophilum]|nr:MAG: hypothetical protein DI539_22700 [Flavobacterium psychrophilum]